MWCNFQRGFLFFVLALSALHSSGAKAQSEDQDLDQIEAEIKKQAPVPKAKIEKPEVIEKKADSLSDLTKSSSFSDVSILQRRYMPKSGRFQFYGGLAASMNDPWNSAYGVSLATSYNLTEAWGVELKSFFMSSTPSPAATDVNSNLGVSAQSFGSMTGFTGLLLNWTPIYGKITLANHKIIPFDMYFSGGAGQTTLTGISNANPTGASIATGQIFAITRSWGLRWDLTWNFYTISVGSLNNVLLSMGACIYFPEASYR